MQKQQDQRPEKLYPDREDILDSFWRSRMQVQDRYVSVRYHQNNRLEYDCALIQKYCGKDTRVLDLGCGTGLIEERLAPQVATIHAVDKYPQFLEKAIRADNVEYIIGEAASFFRGKESYDLILSFGVVFYLSDEELIKMLRNCLDMLAPGGTIIIKGQWGLQQRKVIHKYSEELKSMYYADYRQVDDMRRLCMENGAAVEVVDLYPPEMNRWPDTHDYAFILKKKSGAPIL